MGVRFPLAWMVKMYFRMVTYYSFKKKSYRVKMHSFYVFRMMYVLLLSSFKKGFLLTNNQSNSSKEISYEINNSFIISKKKYLVTVVKAPMSHKKWSKEQLGMKFYYYSSSLKIFNFINFYSPEELYTFFLFFKKNYSYFENPAVFLRSFRLSILLNLKLKLK